MSQKNSLSRNSEIVKKIINEFNQNKLKINLILQPNDENWRDVYEQLRIDHDVNYPDTQNCIEILDREEYYRFGSYGNFSAVIGKAKSRKTFFLTLLIASILNPDCANNIHTILAPSKNVVLLFDTEQSRHDVSKVSKKIRILAGKKYNPDIFIVVAVRALNPSEKLFLFEKIIYNTPNLGVVMIDGIRDFVKDINSAIEATDISTKLLKWTQELEIHIVVVLHQNKDNHNARGHLGTEITNKAETVVSVETDANDESFITPEFTRGKQFTPFAFKIDENNLPVIVDDFQTTATHSIRASIKPENYDNKMHKRILEAAFTERKSYPYTKMCKAIVSAASQKGITIGDNKSKEFLKYYVESKMITKFKGIGVKEQLYKLTEPV